MDFGDRPGSTDGSRYFYLNQEIMRCYLVQFSIQLSRFEDDQMATRRQMDILTDQAATELFQLYPYGRSPSSYLSSYLVGR